MLRIEEYARALRASQKVKRAEDWWARDAPYGWAGRGRVREWKALVWGGVISEIGGFLCVALPCEGFVSKHTRHTSLLTVQKQALPAMLIHAVLLVT
jgi:hypothetical protein